MFKKFGYVLSVLITSAGVLSVAQASHIDEAEKPPKKSKKFHPTAEQLQGAALFMNFLGGFQDNSSQPCERDVAPSQKETFEDVFLVNVPDHSKPSVNHRLSIKDAAENGLGQFKSRVGASYRYATLSDYIYVTTKAEDFVNFRGEKTAVLFAAKEQIEQFYQQHPNLRVFGQITDSFKAGDETWCVVERWGAQANLDFLDYVMHSNHTVREYKGKNLFDIWWYHGIKCEGKDSYDSKLHEKCTLLRQHLYLDVSKPSEV